MSDICDDADFEIEEAINHGIAEARARLRPPRAMSGYCWYCNAPIPDGHAYCDDDCKKDHEYEELIRRKTGG